MKRKGKECKKVPPTCYKCKKIGHKQYDFPEDKKEKKDKKKVENKRFKS